jgi:hypothetical protein
VQIDHQVGPLDVRESTVRDAGRLRCVASAEKRVGQPAGQKLVLLGGRRCVGQRPAQQPHRGVRCLTGQFVGGTAQPINERLVDDGVSAVDRRQDLPRHLLRRGALTHQRTRGVEVPGGPERCRHLLVQGRADQRMPERQFRAVLAQHAHRDRLVKDWREVADSLSRHARQA